MATVILILAVSLGVLILATWTAVTKITAGGDTITDYNSIATVGYYGEAEASETIAVRLENIALQGYTGLTAIASEPWSAVDKASSTWSRIARAGDFGGQAFGTGGFGGTVWTAVTKDS